MTRQRLLARVAPVTIRLSTEAICERCGIPFNLTSSYPDSTQCEGCRPTKTPVLDILNLSDHGLTAREIADELDITVHVVHSHLRRNPA